MPNLLVELAELLVERVVAGGVVEVHGVVLDPVDEGGELGIGLFDTAAADDAVFHVGGEAVFERTAGDADYGEILRQETRLLKVIERGQELALGEVAGCAEDDHDAGVRGALCLRGRGWNGGFDCDACHLISLWLVRGWAKNRG